MRRRRWIYLAAAAVALVLVAGRWLAVATSDDLWASTLGVQVTHAQIRGLQRTMLLIALTSAVIWCVGNLYLVYRSIGSVHVPRRVGNLEFLEAIPRRYLLLAALALGLLLAIALSHDAAGWWYARVLAGYDASVGVRDPVLERDLGYYLFRLPWHRTVHGFATGLSASMLAVCAVLYGAVGAIRWKERRLHVTTLARWHLAGLLFAFAGVLCWGYRLEPPEYVAGVHGVPIDSVLTAVRIPVAGVLTALALAAAATSLLWMWVSRVVLVIVPWALLVAVSIAGHYVMPSFAAAVRTPEELRLAAVGDERDGILEIAYGPAPHEILLPATASPDVRVLQAEAERLRRLPLWDPHAVTTVLNRTLPGGERPARFTTAWLDLYRSAAGEPVPVIVGARQADLAGARDVEADLTWQQVHVAPYAVTEGVAAVFADRVTDTGGPRFVADLARPLTEAEGPALQPLDRGPIVFGPGMVDYAVRPSGPRPITGTPPGGVLRRLALAWALQSPQLLSGERVPATTLVVWHRDVVRRLERYAPFARFEQPRPVVMDGGLLWVAVGVVTADAFPLAPAIRWRNRSVRYLRSGLVGTVDAQTGETTVYLLRAADPLSSAWAQLAAELVRPASHLPSALAAHLSYSESAFAVRLALAAERMAGRPSRASGPPLRLTANTPAGPRVHDWVGRTPADGVTRLRQMAALETEEDGLLAGVLDGSVRDGRPVLEMYRLPQPLEVPGPSRTARQFERRRPGFEGMEGEIRTVPLAGNVLMLQSSYVAPVEGIAGWQLVDVALAWGTAVGNGPSVADAAGRLEVETGPLGAPVSAWAQARRWFERLDAARRAGDWNAFGRAYEELGRLLAGRGDSAP